MKEGQEFCLKYIKSFIPKVLSFVPRGLKEYTDHGVGHSERVEKLIYQIVSKCNSTPDRKFNLNDTEELLLYLASWLHDIGCIIDREGHAARSAEIIGQYFHDIPCIEAYLPALEKIVFCHSNDQDEDDRISALSDEPMKIYGEQVRIKYISAVFRLLDACDIDMDRCPGMVLKILEPHMSELSRKFWQGHRDIIPNPDFNMENGTIDIYVRNIETTDIIIKDLERNLDSVKDVLVEYEFPFTKINVIPIETN